MSITVESSLLVEIQVSVDFVLYSYKLTDHLLLDKKEIIILVELSTGQYGQKTWSFIDFQESSECTLWTKTRNLVVSINNEILRLSDTRTLISYEHGSCLLVLY